jgi:Mrp family chromosome partitioning ATPase
MTDEITESMVHEALGRIAHPAVPHRSLLELGMVADVEIRGAQVRVVLALPHAKAPMDEELVRRVRQAVGEVWTDLDVVVETAEMAVAEREAFLARIREEQRHPPSAAGIETVLAVMSGKGGVGKSSVAALLAATLRRRGFEVGLLDADLTGPSIPRIFGIVEMPEAGPALPRPPAESRNGIKVVSVNLLLPHEDQPIIWRGPLISRAIEQFWRDFAWGRLDYLVVDLPPGTSDAALTVLLSLRVGEIVLVTSPQDLAGMVVRKAANMAKRLGVPIVGLVENMSYLICPRCGARIEAYGPSRAEDTARRLGLSLLGSLPLDPGLAAMCDQGNVEDYRSAAFDGIADMILERLARGGGNASAERARSEVAVR